MKIDTTRHMKWLISLLLLLVDASALAQSKGELLYGQSIEKISEQFLGMKYSGGCLGEGSDGRFDQDPLSRTDEFDCQTYVETVIAINRSVDLASFKNEMNLIRYYKGKTAYELRLHFSETQWIPENIKRGYLTDITDEFLPCNEELVTVDINKWYQSKQIDELKVPNPNEELLQELRSLAIGIEEESIQFSYLRVEKLDAEILQAIPSESIVVFVKKNTSSVGATPVMVTHMGFVIDTPNGKMLRHATPLKDYKKVTDMNLAEYITRFKSQATAEKFPAVGIKILMINSK